MSIRRLVLSHAFYMCASMYVVVKMKIKRYKKVNKFLNFYVNNYKFRQPYQLLIDGTFCLAALSNQINIADNIPKYLQADLKILTTQCAIVEMEKLERKSLSGPLQILKRSIIHKCGHEKSPLPGLECLLSMVGDGNASHYIVATQDRDLQKKIRLEKGVPLLYLHSKAPVLDPPSRLSLDFAADHLKVDTIDKPKIDRMKLKDGIQESAQNSERKRKKWKGGANPLSCKKKMKRSANVKGDKLVGVKKAGGKVRIAKHVKLELSKSKP